LTVEHVPFGAPTAIASDPLRARGSFASGHVATAHVRGWQGSRRGACGCATVLTVSSWLALDGRTRLSADALLIHASYGVSRQQGRLDASRATTVTRVHRFAIGARTPRENLRGVYS